MAQLCTLSDGTDTVNFYDYSASGLADDGHDLGVPGASPRTLKLQAHLFTNAATALTLPQLEVIIGKIRRLLAKAERTTALGLPRQVALTVQPEGIAVPTRYYLLGGAVEPVAPWRHQYLISHIYDGLGITLSVEPWGYGAETSLVSSGALYGRASIDARFVATGASGTGVVGTTAGVNTAALSAGSLAQNNKLTTTPTLTTVANQVAFYFGCTFATFDRLILGIETAKTGTWSGAWEIMTGAATFIGISTTSEFRSGAEGTEFDTIRRLGQIVLTGSTAAWTLQAVGGVTAYWLRYRITSFTSGLAPVMMNGPVRSLANVAAIATGAVPGDQEAAGLVHLTNATGASAYSDTAPNLISNPSVETNTTGYLAFAGTIARSALAAARGGFGIILSTTNAIDSEVYWDSAGLTGLTPGTTYTFSLFAALALAGSHSMTLRIDWLTSGSVLLSQSFRTITLASTVMARYSLTAIAPATADRVNLVFGVSGAPSGVFDVYTDGWMFEASAAIAALAGVKAAIATGELATVPPPMVIDLAGADLFIPTVDTTAAITADANANDGDRVDLNLLASITDRAQTLDGVAEYITLTPLAGGKLGTLPAGSFSVEVLFRLNSIPDGPVCLASQWSGTLSTSSYWLGIDGGNLRFLVSTGTARKGAIGTSQINVGEWVLATGTWNKANKETVLRRDAIPEGHNTNVTTVDNGNTTPVRVGKSSGFNGADSRSGSDAEGFLPATIANARMWANDIGGEYPLGNYVWPDLGTAIQNDSADTRWLLKMEDNAASLTIVDSATTFAAALNAARSAANTSTRSVVGYFQAGVGSTSKILGLNLPRTWAEEYRGRVRILLRATPAATLTTVDDALFQLQLNVGDSALPLGPPARFPNIAVPSSAYYLLDLGTYSLPPTALRYAGFGNPLTSAKNVLQATLFVKHLFLTSTVLRLDCLYLLPVTTWYGEYATFRDTYNTAYDIDQNTGVLFDSMGPETVVAQATSLGYTDPFRNPYSEVGGAAQVRMVPNAPAWLFCVPLRGIVGGPDYLEHVLGDSVQPVVRAVGRYEALAAS